MSIILDIINEEKERLTVLQKKYYEIICSFPKGSISLKQRSKKKFAYLCFRDKKKVIFKYVGVADSQKVISLEHEIQERKKYEEKLKKIKSDLKEINRVISRR